MLGYGRAMELAQRVAPEIDRLVLGVNEGAEAEHGRWLLETAQKAGLAAPGPATHFADFLLAGRLTADIARRRTPYAPPRRIAEWLGDLVTRDLIVDDAGLLAGTSRLEHLLEGILEVRAEVATNLWSEHESAVDVAAMGASMVIEEIPDEFVVAAAHASLPEPEDHCLRLHSRLTTLRYIRQHAHVEAWRGRNLNAEQVIALTRLWKEHDLDPDHPAIPSLVELGYVDTTALVLTTVGSEIRQMIEEETNRNTQPVFDVLGNEMGDEFAEALTSLPGR